VSSRNEHLVELIRQGISGGNCYANCCPSWLPKSPGLFVGETVEHKGEDGIFGQVGRFAEESVKKIEGAPRDLEVEEMEYPSKQSS